MVSQMAMEDIEALREEGIEVTPEEIIRLNAFGLKVERNNDSSEFYVMPRVSMLGDVTFYEPTIGSEMWLNRASKTFDLDDADTFMQLRAYSLSRPQEQLVSPDDKELLKKTVCDFVTQSLSKYTVQQVQNAISYVIFGNDHSKCEKRSESSVKKESKKDIPEDENFCYEVGLLRQGLICKIGTVAEIKKMTTTELQMFIDYEMFLRFGSDRNKSQHERDLVEYYGVLDEIRSTHK